ncbi:MAG TPA: hypothetical protein PKY30_08160 [Myxococcota bacterium]|nr:hypothetical protein [Myxococcota bacterium]HNH46996.1 hypothetical protein [Myxococcota bacterium]
MSTLELFAEDFSPPERQRGLDAMRSYTGHLIEGPGPEFDQAYAALWEEFGEKGELENRAVLLDDLKGPRPRNGGVVRYHLMTFHEGERLVGIRDVFSVCFPDRKFCYVLLSHSLVLPAWRRSGVATLIRAAPAAAARRALQEEGAALDCDRLLMAEMDPIDPHSDPTVIRVLAYGKAGFRMIAPDWLPYVQPDFSDWKVQNRAPRPIPMVPVLRWVGHEEAEALPAQMIRGLLDGIDAIHLKDYPEDVAVRRANADRVWAGRSPVPTIGVDPRALGRLAPLLRAAAVPQFSLRLGGSGGEPVGNASKELEELLAKWSKS